MKLAKILILLLFLVSTNSAQTRETVTVKSLRANLRGTPDVNGSVVAEVKRDQRFSVITKRGNWVLVETDEYVGWLHQTVLGTRVLSSAGDRHLADGHKSKTGQGRVVESQGAQTTINSDYNVGDRFLSLAEAIALAERDFGIPEGLLEALGYAESTLMHYDQDGSIKTSPTGRRGVFQFTKATARRYGINRDNPMENVVGAAAYARDNYKRFKPLLDDDDEAWMAAMVAHNRGEGAVEKTMIKNRRFVPSGRDSGNRGDTNAYAVKIANRWAENLSKKKAPAASPMPDVPGAENARNSFYIPDNGGNASPQYRAEVNPETGVFGTPEEVAADDAFHRGQLRPRIGQILQQPAKEMAGQPKALPTDLAADKLTATGQVSEQRRELPVPREDRPEEFDKRPIDSKTNRRDGVVEPGTPISLPVGSSPLGSGMRSGQSILTVSNGTDSDALVRVVRHGPNEQLIRNFYIPAGLSHTAEELPPGSYVMRVAFGSDWNASDRRFNFRRSFTETEMFLLTETEFSEHVPGGIRTTKRSSKLTITLHKVRNGNFSSTQISEDDFWNLNNY